MTVDFNSETKRDGRRLRSICEALKGRKKSASFYQSTRLPDTRLCRCAERKGLGARKPVRPEGLRKALQPDGNGPLSGCGSGAGQRRKGTSHGSVKLCFPWANVFGKNSTEAKIATLHHETYICRMEMYSNHNAKSGRKR